MCAIDGRLVDDRHHFNRLRRGTEFLGIPISHSNLDFENACTDILRANNLEFKRASVRLTVTRGPGARGLLPSEDLKPTILITSVAALEPPSEMNVIIAGIRRNEHSPLTQFKTLNYLENILARREAAAKGVDEAVMLNTEGNVACASAANVWLVEGRQLITPPVRDGALPGIVRQRLTELAPQEGFDIVEETVKPARLERANELLLSNSLIGICPIQLINDKKSRGAIVSARLKDAYWERVTV
jgi:branched-chain amino acid aminotransferase